MIDIQKIVNTDFKVVKTQAPVGSYKSVLYVAYDDAPDFDNAKKIYSTLSGINITATGPNTYFQTLTVPAASWTASNVATQILQLKKQVSGTDYDFIFVCFSADFNPTSGGVQPLIAEINKFEAPYKVIGCFTCSIDNISGLPSMESLPVAIKLSVNSSKQQACLSIPAYFSQIQLDRSNSIKDYCYTPEQVIQLGDLGDEIYSQVNILDSQYDIAIKHANFLNQVGKSVVNFGGNLTNGVSIAAQFGAIAVENDIIRAVLDAMLKKQYLNNEGLNNIISSINNAMTRYTYNGLLEQNGIYTGDTYVENYTNPPTTLIKKGVVLPEGYYVSRIPMSKLNMTDRKARKFTPIRIFMQTLSGARVVEIEGTILD